MATLTFIATFNGTDGANPSADLIANGAGDLFSTTANGTVFEITNSSSGYASTPTVLVTFNSTIGSVLNAGLLADATGDLFGVTANGPALPGTDPPGGNGTVFEIANTSTGYASTPTTLVTFPFFSYPQGGLIADAAGDLLGTTEGGGTNLDGSVYEVAKTSTGYASAPTTLVSFNGSDGANPWDALVANAAGDLFGTTAKGGEYGDGTVFEIAKTSTGYASTPTTLVSFNGDNGSTPYAGLIINAAGDLFGTTYLGGADGYGTVFEITKNLLFGYAKTPTTLVTFDDTNGANPYGGLIADAAGDLFGTTTEGGTGSFGTAFEIAKTHPGYASTPTTLVNFNGAGASPLAGLLANAAGDLFGTTYNSPDAGAGGVFELTDTGFVTGAAPCFAAGTRISTERGEIAVEAIRVGDLVQVLLGNEPAPVIWAGRREVDCTRHPKPEQVWPVRIAVGAFGPGRPHSELFLSPDHSVYVEEVLIPVKLLINGSTIVQVPMDRVTYHHIELPQHDVVLAQGLPAESYLDMKDGSKYANRPEPMPLYPDFYARMWEAFGCAPRVVTGPGLEGARALAARFATLQTMDRWHAANR